jgi:hypothetical protein
LGGFTSIEGVIYFTGELRHWPMLPVRPDWSFREIISWPKDRRVGNNATAVIETLTLRVMIC